MDAINLLIKEHEKVRAILDNISSNDHYDSKIKMFEELSSDLLRHEEMEHSVWYPRFKDNNKVDDTVRHLISEEKGAERAIKSLDRTENEHDWDIKFNKFKNDVQQHANEEEEKLFPLIRRLLSEEELITIGQEMLSFKKNYSH